MVADIADLERRVALLEQKAAAADNLRQQDAAEIAAEIAQLAAQVAAFEQRTGRRFLGLETRMANIETRMGNIETHMGNVETALEGQRGLLGEILRRLPT